MKEVDEFRRQNGNVTYTVKELIGALHIKMDKIQEKKASKKMVLGMFGGILTFLTIVVALLK